MTDTNEDRLEEIKRPRSYAIKNDRAWVTIEKDEHDWLIEEVERTRSERDQNEEACNIRKKQTDEFWKQIDSLTKERDGWKERYMKSTRKDFVEKTEKLEAENAELKQKLAEAESKKCPACHGKGSYWWGDPARGKPIFLQCKVCEGRGEWK